MVGTPLKTTFEMHAPDGTKLHGTLWHPSEQMSTAAIFYVHGLQSHAGWLDDTGEHLAGHGVELHVPCRRGSGASGGVRGHFSLQALQRDYLRMWDKFVAETPGLARILLGQSFGGSLATALLVTGCVAPDAVILMSPALGQQAHRRARRLDLGRVDPLSRIQIPLLDEDYTSSPGYRRRLANDHAMLRFLTAEARNALLDVEDAYLSVGSNFGGPALMIIPEFDPIVNNAASRQHFRRLFPRGEIQAVGTHEHYLEFSTERMSVLARILGLTKRATSSVAAR